MSSHRISQLIYRHLLGTITDKERAELAEWMARHPENAELAKTLTDPATLGRDIEDASHIDISRPAADMRRRITSLHRGRYIRATAIAASVAALLLTGIFVAVRHIDLSSSATPVIAEAPIIETLEDIRPGSTCASLTSSAGSTLALTGGDSGQSAPAITRRSSILAQAADTVSYCLDVPRGGEFKIVLEDSTEIWLNSQSQLRYPETFARNERRIQLTGEAYMRVAHDPDRPFYVESLGQEVRVYGTTFNIKAYDDEEMIYTTLESGSISLRPLSGYGGEIIMSPGHQAMYDCSNEQIDMKVVKPSVITGWRHGRFVFEEQNLRSIMRDLSRWYDFEYEFADDKAGEIVFLGSIPRYSDFTTAIAILEKSGNISFTLSDSKVIISSL